mmetsp:Transcript_25548/g.49724  ORF Transcript_25548/g.49724 Transcript_25548/m.49724 type:complete len:433 (+) Transcript_25548:54-1352(+)
MRWKPKTGSRYISKIKNSYLKGALGKQVARNITWLQKDRSKKARRLRVWLSVLGLFLLYILHDILQEKAFRNKDFHFGWLMTTIELGVFASCANLFEGASIRSPPKSSVLALFGMLSLVLALSQGSGSAALQYVSFPLKVCFKSCKLIPTMMLGVLITGRRYSTLQYVSAVLMCLSLILLVSAPASASSRTLVMKTTIDDAPAVPTPSPVLSTPGGEGPVASASSEKLPPFKFPPPRAEVDSAKASLGITTATEGPEGSNDEAADAGVTRGVLLLLMAIGCDAIVPNIQEKVLKGMGILAVDMIMWTNMLSGLGTLLFTIVSGELSAALTLFAVEPQILFWLICQAISGYCGLRCYLLIVRERGAVFAVVVTSFRKIATIVLSFLVFTKPFTRRHFMALVILQMGISCMIVSRRLSTTKYTSRMKGKRKPRV